jgi:hypothetical protein
VIYDRRRANILSVGIAPIKSVVYRTQTMLVSFLKNGRICKIILRDINIGPTIPNKSLRCEISGSHGDENEVCWVVAPCSHVEVDRRFTVCSTAGGLPQLEPWQLQPFVPSLSYQHLTVCLEAGFSLNFVWNRHLVIVTHLDTSRSRWSSGYRACYCTQGSLVQNRPKTMVV